MNSRDRQLQDALQEIERLRSRCEDLERQGTEHGKFLAIEGYGSKTWVEMAWKLLGYCLSGEWQQGSGSLLRIALKRTQSEYGFIGVVVEQGTLRILAHEGVVWHQTTNRAFYDSAMRAYRETGYLEFTNLDNLFGEVIRTGRSVRTNDAALDPRAKKSLPPGHPPLRQFLGVPAYHRGEVVGMIGVANCASGFGQQQEDELHALAEVIAPLYESYGLHLRDVLLMEQLQQSQTRLLRVLEEREDLAQHLYDKCFQLTYSVGLAIDQWAYMARQHGYSEDERVRSLVDGLSSFMAEIRTYLVGSHQIRGQMTIKDQLVQLAERMKGIQGLAFVIDVDQDTARVLSPDVTCQLLFIAQAAISNARRHAGVREIRIELSRSGQQATLRVIDNGGEWDGESRERVVLGITAMRNRAKMLQGTVHMVSRPDGGGEVLVEFPLNSPPC